MNQKGLSFYQKIRRWAKNTTAVAVRNQACMGCYMAINDKTYSEVIKGEEIVTCPHCGRLLYLEPQDDSISA
jgi:predicted  nucleic acid-binding Zn-ribbon protein